MLRLGTRLGLAACGRPFIGGLLARGLAAPALVHAASVAVPFISTCDHAGIPGRGSAVDLRAALGLAVGVGVLVAQPDATECLPKPKGKGRAAPAAQPPPAKKKAGPALDAIAAAPHRATANTECMRSCEVRACLGACKRR